jgi:glycerol-3-phosphate O-acyltransferase
VLKLILEATQHALVVPVYINFDRVLQPTAPKTLDTLKQIVNSKQNYGKVLVKYGSPILTHSKKYEESKAQIEAQHQQNIVVMNTALVAAALLMHRRGINFENLIQRVTMIYDELMARRVPVAATRPPTHKMIKTALSVIHDHYSLAKGIYEPKPNSI